MPETGLRSLGQGSQIRAWNGEGRAGSRHGVPKTETKVVEGQDTRWKVLEGAWVVGMRGSEFQCYTECNTRSVCPHPIRNSVTIRSGVDAPFVQRRRNPSELTPILP